MTSDRGSVIDTIKQDIISRLASPLCKMLPIKLYEEGKA